jgi:hypothetical protein
MAIAKELTVRLANSPGSLGRVAKVVGDVRVNILAMSLDGAGSLRIVTDNPLHAAGELREQHYQVNERDVLYTTLSNEAGSLAKMLKVLTDAGVNIDYAYATGIDRVSMVAVVIAVPDAQKAAYLTGI